VELSLPDFHVCVWLAAAQCSFTYVHVCRCLGSSQYLPGFLWHMQVQQQVMPVTELVFLCNDVCIPKFYFHLRLMCTILLLLRTTQKLIPSFVSCTPCRRISPTSNSCECWSSHACRLPNTLLMMGIFDVELHAALQACLQCPHAAVRWFI